MSGVLIEPRPLCGEVVPPPSKSDAHRALICAALCDGISTLSPIAPSQDIESTAGGLRALGAKAELLPDGRAVVNGGRRFAVRRAEIDCGESGSTLRFLIPVAAAGGVPSTFTGCGRLPQRPLGPYFNALPGAGVSLGAPGGGINLPLTLSGRLRPGMFRLPGNVSSQFVTGLLFALPLLDGDSEIVLTTPTESAGYIDLTLRTLHGFGIAVQKTAQGFFVRGGQHYAARDYAVERDWSQAAFWLAAGALGCKVRCGSLPADSGQGDRAILALLRSFGAAVSQENGGVSVDAPETGLHGTQIDARGVPDLVPVLAAVAAGARGETRILNAQRLRLKESDRLRAMAEGLYALGGHAEELPDGLVIHGTGRLRGGEADSFNDHRIAMALAVASLICDGPVTIHGSECVAKSYPDFFTVWNQLGGSANVVDVAR